MAIDFKVPDLGENVDSGDIVNVMVKEGDEIQACLLYTSDAADDLLCVDLGGRRIIKKKQHHNLPPLPLPLALYTR